jgi:hypothetical protein
MNIWVMGEMAPALFLIPEETATPPCCLRDRHFSGRREQKLSQIPENFQEIAIANDFPKKKGKTVKVYLFGGR